MGATSGLPIMYIAQNAATVKIRLKRRTRGDDGDALPHRLAGELLAALGRGRPRLRGRRASSRSRRAGSRRSGTRCRRLADALPRAALPKPTEKRSTLHATAARDPVMAEFVEGHQHAERDQQPEHRTEEGSSSESARKRKSLGQSEYSSKHGGERPARRLAGRPRSRSQGSGHRPRRSAGSSASTRFDDVRRSPGTAARRPGTPPPRPRWPRSARRWHRRRRAAPGTPARGSGRCPGRAFRSCSGGACAARSSGATPASTRSGHASA